MDKMLKDFIGVIKEIDEVERTMTVLISTPDIDRQGEMVEPMGMDLANYQKNPVVLWAHQYDKPPIAKSLWIKATKDGIIAKLQFALTLFASEIYHLYKDGFLNCWSVGFMPSEWVDGQKDGDPRRRFTKGELLEYSAVPVPANPQALTQLRTMAIKSKGLVDAIEDEQKKLDDAAIPPERTYTQAEMDAVKAEIDTLTADVKSAGEIKFGILAELETAKTAAASAPILAEELKAAQDKVVELGLKLEGKPDDGQVPIEIPKKSEGITAGEAQAIIETSIAGALTKEFNRQLGKT